jgi:hypothetical protein
MGKTTLSLCLSLSLSSASAEKEDATPPKKNLSLKKSQKKIGNERSSFLALRGAERELFWACLVPLLPISCPAMWGQIPALCAGNVVAQTSKKRVGQKIS